jgi:hypothetical protein
MGKRWDIFICGTSVNIAEPNPKVKLDIFFISVPDGDTANIYHGENYLHYYFNDRLDGSSGVRNITHCAYSYSDPAT